MSNDVTTARELLRVSKDRSGRERSNEEQHADNSGAAERRGWALVGEPYHDIGSASRYARKARADFGRLIADLESAAFGADVLIMWESSRGSRRVSEWARLIDLCEDREVKIFVTSDVKLYDPSDGRDRKALHDDASDAEYESDKTSKRSRRAHAAAAASGWMGPGHPPFGYRRVYDAESGRLVGQVEELAEAETVREIFRRVRAGDSLRAIAADLTERGVLRRGVPFTGHTLRVIALNRAYLGERVHDPSRKGNPQGLPGPNAAITAAVWPAIVDRALWSDVNHRLTDPARTTIRPGRATHWLSGVALCDTCGGPMAARERKDMATPEWMYVCHRATHVTVPYDALNAYVELTLLEWLARDDIAHLLTAEHLDPGAVGAAETELRAVERERDDLADQLGSGSPTARAMLARALPKIEARLSAARARRDELAAPALLRGLIEPGEDVRGHWAGTAVPARREIARLVLVPALLGELRVDKGALRAPIDERVTFRRV
jgi:site-specific DNA recombinase